MYFGYTKHISSTMQNVIGLIYLPVFIGHLYFNYQLVILLQANNIITRAQLFKASLAYELVMGHFVNCFSRFNIQYSDIFC